jgi:hypothetical protein
MADLKTQKTAVSVESFLLSVADEKQREDSFDLLTIMKEVTGLEPKMWGPTMVGFGEYHYKYASGHEGDIFKVGFSPRKGKMTLYVMPGGPERCAVLLKKLGKHKAMKGCLYVNKLADVDETVLRELIAKALKDTDLIVEQKMEEAAAKKKPRSKK